MANPAAVEVNTHPWRAAKRAGWAKAQPARVREDPVGISETIATLEARGPLLKRGQGPRLCRATPAEPSLVGGPDIQLVVEQSAFKHHKIYMGVLSILSANVNNAPSVPPSAAASPWK